MTVSHEQIAEQVAAVRQGVEATVNVRLGTGQVVGATPSTCASITVNGVSIPVT